MPIVARPRTLAAPLGLAAAIALAIAPPAPADEPSAEPTPVPVAVANTVKLDLQITGVAAGWRIRVKPAHPGSRFKPVVREIDHGDGAGPVQLDEIAIDARSLSADRDCALAIVLIDPEGDEQTFKRSVRLLPQPDAGTVPEVSKTFYLRTSTVASKGNPRRKPD